MSECWTVVVGDSRRLGVEAIPTRPPSPVLPGMLLYGRPYDKQNIGNKTTKALVLGHEHFGRRSPIPLSVISLRLKRVAQWPSPLYSHLRPCRAWLFGGTATTRGQPSR